MSWFDYSWWVMARSPWLKTWSLFGSWKWSLAIGRWAIGGSWGRMRLRARRAFQLVGWKYSIDFEWFEHGFLLGGL
jgi:hypothetical protein